MEPINRLPVGLQAINNPSSNGILSLIRLFGIPAGSSLTSPSQELRTPCEHNTQLHLKNVVFVIIAGAGSLRANVKSCTCVFHTSNYSAEWECVSPQHSSTQMSFLVPLLRLSAFSDSPGGRFVFSDLIWFWFHLLLTLHHLYSAHQWLNWSSTSLPWTRLRPAVEVGPCFPSSPVSLHLPR